MYANNVIVKHTSPLTSDVTTTLTIDMPKVQFDRKQRSVAVGREERRASSKVTAR